MKFIRMIILVSSLSFAASCSNGTSTGNPVVSFRVNGSSQNATVARLDFWDQLFTLLIPTAVAAPSSIVDSVGRTIILDNFWTTLGEVEFKATEVAEVGEIDGTDTTFTGPYTFNILDTVVDPVGTIQISTRQIRRIKIKLNRTATLPAAAPANLMNNSIYISGQVNAVAFSYSSQDETVIEVAGPNPVAVSDNSSLLMQIQVANIFKKIDLAAISAPTDISESNRVNATNPCPNIDASATDLYTCFRKGLETEANFGRDNGDDELDINDDTVK